MRPPHRPFIWILALATAVLAGCPWPWGSPPPSPLAGRVIDSQGHPVAKVQVRASFTNAIPFTNPIPVSIAAVTASTAEVTTNSDGRFSFSDPPVGQVNLEAVQSDASKAVKQSVAVRSGVNLDVGDLSLAPTGVLEGRVLTPGVTGVDLLGIDVFIPGLGYAAKTDELGNFRLPNLPAGHFRLVASHPSLGSGEVADVAVKSGATAHVDGLAIALNPPTITDLQPASGAPGASFAISGRNFGRTTTGGNAVEVYLNGLRLGDVTVDSDSLIHARVPTGAGSGKVVVKVGLISGTSDRSFQVLTNLSLFPPGPLLLPMGTTARFVASASDGLGTAIPDPAVGWGIASDGRLKLDGAVAGQVLGQQLGSSWVAINNGSLTASAAVFVNPAVGAPVSLASGAGHLAVAVGGGGAMVAWAANGDGGSFRLVAQRLAGTPWSPSDLPLVGPLAGDPCPAIAWDGAGSHFYLAFVDGVPGARQIKLITLGSTGAIQAGPTVLADSLSEVAALRIATRGNDALVCWQDPAGAIMAVVSSVSSPAVQLVASQASAPSAAWDGSQYWVGWEQAVGGDTQVILRPVTVGGAIAGQAIQAASGRSGQHAPTLAAGIGHMLVAWSEDRNGSREITAQRVVGGAAVGTPVALGASHPNHGREEAPCLAWDGTRYLLAWLDGRQDAPGVFAQVLDRDLTGPGPAYCLALGGMQDVRLAGSGTDAFAIWQSSVSPLAVSGQRISP